jgi:hypothetical protein
MSKHHYHAVVWIDHHEARVFHFSLTDVERLVLQARRNLLRRAAISALILVNVAYLAVLLLTVGGPVMQLLGY